MQINQGFYGTIGVVSYFAGSAIVHFLCGARHHINKPPIGLKGGDTIMIDCHGRIWLMVK